MISCKQIKVGTEKDGPVLQIVRLAARRYFSDRTQAREPVLFCYENPRIIKGVFFMKDLLSNVKFLRVFLLIVAIAFAVVCISLGISCLLYTSERGKQLFRFSES